jgi:hypothetical protein
LHSKYKYLENNQDSFEYFKKMAGIEWLKLFSVKLNFFSVYINVFFFF